MCIRDRYRAVQQVLKLLGRHSLPIVLNRDENRIAGGANGQRDDPVGFSVYAVENCIFNKRLQCQFLDQTGVDGRVNFTDEIKFHIIGKTLYLEVLMYHFQFFAD